MTYFTLDYRLWIQAQVEAVERDPHCISEAELDDLCAIVDEMVAYDTMISN